jgi:hypothetical protein
LIRIHKIKNNAFISFQSAWVLDASQLVNLPKAASMNDFVNQFTLPDFTQFANYKVYVLAVTIAIIASLESLLSTEAADKLDPFKRVTPTNRELKAQGIGNIVSGLIGGMPMTAVIVRTSANVNAGGKTKLSAIFHGLLLLVSVAFFASFLNQIPLPCLAAVLLLVGYKLAKVSLFKEMYKLFVFMFPITRARRKKNNNNSTCILSKICLYALTLHMYNNSNTSVAWEIHKNEKISMNGVTVVQTACAKLCLHKPSVQS